MLPPNSIQVPSRIFQRVFPGASLLRKIFPAFILVCWAVSGCGTSCYSGFWNGNGSGVAVSNTSCPLTPATGKVAVQVGAASVSSAASISAAGIAFVPSPRDIQHLYITFRGIAAHSSSAADDAASGWQQLAPSLIAHPLQLDLLSADGASGLALASGGATDPPVVRADEYRQLRLQLLPFHPAQDVFTPESNSCGSAGWDCVVFADGSTRPLEFASGDPEIRIASAHGGENLFRVLPGENVQLSVELDPKSSAFISSESAVRIVPVFKVVARTF